MTFKEEFAQALRHQRMLMKRRPDRLRMRALIYLIWLVGFGLFFATINGLQSGRLGSAGWWLGDVPGHMLVSACVTACFVIGFRGFERLAPQRWLDTIMGWRDWRSGVFFSTFSIACSLLGVVIGLGVVDRIWLSQGLDKLLAQPGFWREFLSVSVLVTFIMGLRYRARWKQEMLQARVTEAQLKLLQGQIEPHFLFNTLANVQSLIDFDPERAKLMLERFTDYLRASLGQLRGDATTLAQEFAMLEAYLGLMQLRMGERLKVELALPAELGGIEVPPLLAQPLVENAIHHGLEPKIAGGTVAVSARRVDGRLWIEVADDGQGLDGPKRRGGNGVALGNIRARLAARFGPSATLDLLPRDGGGTLARIQIPLPAQAS
ncbi:sensor histidine kinase [Roseateles saccharophilus]|uniref:Histidine kinase n=1 Tax=Roseateles saccharophilus TaxID=304 RepID=A0A4R3UND3_ROSSA|nr:sensor histidine kinase [Roseateles saccharophilus]MDG0833620.1 sensor histidine kinase [Roseateles saccharophilus]TCU93206.1 histidine kinase [Roseateles saccharophilus]